MPTVYDSAIATARRYAESNMTDEVSIVRPSDAVLNDVTGRLTAVTDFVVYSGKARVYPAAGPLMLGLGDDSQEYQNAYISIPMEVTVDDVVYSPAPRPGDVVTVTAHADALMVDRSFQVKDVEAGGLLPVVRRMQAMGVEDSSEWVNPNAPDVPVWP